MSGYLRTEQAPAPEIKALLSTLLMAENGFVYERHAMGPETLAVHWPATDNPPLN